MHGTDAMGSAIDALTARVDALQGACDRLAAENAELRATVCGMDGEPESAGGSHGEDMSRRHLLRTTVGAAAAAAAGAALAEPAISAAKDGDSILAGKETLAESATQLHFDGATNPGVFFLVNDTSFTAIKSVYPAAVGGWAHGSTVTNGVFGFTQASGGSGVVGSASGANAIGVFGQNGNGIGVNGSGTTYGVLGQSGAFLPALPSAEAGVAAQAAGGVPGVAAASDNGPAVIAESKNGYGVQARGETAQLYLVPAGKPGAPTTGKHQLGEIYLDSTGTIFVCTASGSPGTWKKVSAS